MESGTDISPDVAGPGRRWWGGWAVWVVVAIVIVAAGMRFYRLGANDFWLDELLSMELSTGHGCVYPHLPKGEVIDPAPVAGRLDGTAGLRGVWDGMRTNEVMPPLYFLVLRVWRELFGDGEAAVRSLSALSAVATVALSAGVAGTLYGRHAAVAAAAVAAVAPVQVQMAQEARPYALSAALCAGAMLVLVRMGARGATWGRAVLLAVLVYAAVLTQYFSLGPALAMAVYAAIAMRGRTRFVAIGAMAAAGVAYLATWGPGMVAQRGAMSFAVGQVAVAGRSVGQFVEAIGIALAFQVAPTRVDSVAVMVVIGAAFVAATVVAVWLGRHDPRMLAGPLWVLCSIGVLAAVDLLTRSQTLAVARYGIVAGPGLFWTVAGPLAVWKWTWGRYAAAVALGVVSALSLGVAYELGRGDWQGTAAAMRSAARPGDVLVVAATRSEYWWPGRTALGLLFYADGWRPPVVLLTERPDEKALARLRAAPGLWVVTDSSEVGPEAVVPGTVATGARKVPFVAMVYRARWADDGK